VIRECGALAKRLGHERIDGNERMRLLAETLRGSVVRLDSPSASASETLELFSDNPPHCPEFWMAALGGCVSMTRYPSDLLMCCGCGNGQSNPMAARDDAGLHLPIVPLFETIGDLQGDGHIVDRFRDAAYRDAVRTWGD